MPLPVAKLNRAQQLSLADALRTLEWDMTPDETVTLEVTRYGVRLNGAWLHDDGEWGTYPDPNVVQARSRV